MRRFVIVTILSLFTSLDAATAILDCIGDGYGTRGGRRWRGSDKVLPLHARDQVVAFQFRSTSLKGWRATGAKLMVHLERGKIGGQHQLMAAYSATFDEASLSGGALKRADVPVSVPASEAGSGWWEIALPQSIAQRVVDQPNGAIVLTTIAAASGADAPALHSREALQFVPRLIVEGAAALPAIR